jgi:hypothetical protein
MKRLLLLLITFLVSERALGQNPTYQLILSNDAQLSSTVYEFDVYIIQTGATAFELSELQLVMSFNTGISSGTLTFSMNGGTSELNSAQQPTGPFESGNLLIVPTRTPPGSGNGTIISISPGLRVGRFRITSSVPFIAQSPNVEWRNVDAGNPYTKVFCYVNGTNTEITDPQSHDNLLQGAPLPIQLASSAVNVIRANDVEISWKTVSETNNYGFEVYRRRNENGEWRKLGFLQGHGTTLTQQAYLYLDKSVGFGNFFYQIKQVDLDGKSQVFPEMAVTVGVGPDKFVLAQNYPNPFNPSTTIEFAVPQNGFATMRVYNTLGQEVATLFRGEVTAGIHSVEWSPTNLASGVYVYRLEVDNGMQHFFATRRLALMK